MSSCVTASYCRVHCRFPARSSLLGIPQISVLHLMPEEEHPSTSIVRLARFLAKAHARKSPLPAPGEISIATAAQSLASIMPEFIERTRRQVRYTNERRIMARLSQMRAARPAWRCVARKRARDASRCLVTATLDAEILIVVTASRRARRCLNYAETNMLNWTRRKICRARTKLSALFAIPRRNGT
jgi:hypothetical protein